MKTRGFTLIELLIVIAIIGLLSTFAIVALNSARTQARDAKRLADVRQVAMALEILFNDTGTYPSIASGSCEANGWSALRGATASYLPLPPTDPKGPTTPYVYCGDRRASSQEYVLRAQLETNHAALANDFDGTFFTAWSGQDITCADPYYCLTVCKTVPGTEGPNNESGPPQCGSW